MRVLLFGAAGLQWSLIWYRPEIDDRMATRERLADAMVRTLVLGLATRSRPAARKGSVRRR